MASLLEHEQMAGEVQCIYFDPPYGMDFHGRYMDDTVQVTAFRDSYEGGIHTYLDGIREIALLARELLLDNGSFFMQIGDVNVHRCAMLLDEVFGPENRVSTIMYATGGGEVRRRVLRKPGTSFSGMQRMSQPGCDSRRSTKNKTSRRGAIRNRPSWAWIYRMVRAVH